MKSIALGMILCALSSVQVRALEEPAKPAADDFATVKVVAGRDVFELAAARGRRAIPLLQRLSPTWDISLHTNNSQFGSIRGNAQVALAKLGEKDALNAIAEELLEPDRNSQMDALDKLVFIGDRDSVSTLIELMRRFRSDPSRRQQGSDYYYDRLRPIDLSLSLLVPSPPVQWQRYSKSRQEDDARIDSWIEWWNSKDVQGKRFDFDFPLNPTPEAQLTFRRIDWQIADAILDLPKFVDRGALLPLLSQLAHGLDRTVTYQSGVRARFGSVPGKAQALGAKLGDDQLFKEIGTELQVGDSSDAIEKLKFVGDERAVAMLISFLDEGKFPPFQRKTYQVFFDLDPTVRALRALATIVPNAPVITKDSPEKSDIRLWKEWLKNGDNQQSRD